MKWFIELAAALILATAVPGPALAVKPMEFTAAGTIAVTSISDPIPAGDSGRVRIESETIGGIIITGPDELAGKVLALQQKSNELFSSSLSDPENVVALDGSSVGTFAVMDPANPPVASGGYHLSVSNIAPGTNTEFPDGCQVYDQGHWSTTGGSELKGGGQVTACLNFDPMLGTFVGSIAFTGNLN